MKKILYILAVLFLVSCEDKVNIDLDTASPKLVIDATISWQKGTLGNDQKIKLSLTTSFYSNVIPPASGATVFITNSSNTIFNFIEILGTGEYACSNFNPVLNETYTLTIQYQGQTYTATDTLLPTPTIDGTQQTTVQGFGGDEIQVKFFYQDNGLENNNYLIGVQNSAKLLPEYGVLKDEFFQGNQMFGFYTDSDLKANDVLNFSLKSITLRYFNYMNKLLNLAGNTNGSPFATPPVTLRGNIINQTNEQEYPLGYFHLSETDTLIYTVQ